MITREQAIEAAVEYLTGGLRRRLKAFEGWPGETGRNGSGELSNPMEIPDFLPKPDARAPEIKGMPRQVWHVRVPDNDGHVGADRFIIIDAETGRVFTSMRWGE